VASDIVTVRECVGVAFSFAEKFEQSVFLRWDRLAVSLSPVGVIAIPPAVASFGGAIVTVKRLRPLTFLCDSLVSGRGSLVWLWSLLSARRLPIPMPGGAFIRYPCLAGGPLRWAKCCSSATGRNKPRVESREPHNRTPTSDMFVEV
jgi:hypothetical protein